MSPVVLLKYIFYARAMTHPWQPIYADAMRRERRLPHRLSDTCLGEEIANIIRWIEEDKTFDELETEFQALLAAQRAAHARTSPATTSDADRAANTARLLAQLRGAKNAD